ncbi:hypothetical protein GCM10010872_02920 [Dyella flava]|nr:hypothetical protein GCM10010872_02920 [Dyella flava]
MSKCPKCEMTISRFRMERIKAQESGSALLWNCLAYNCPHCGTVVSMQIDPILVRDEIVAEVKASLSRQ